MKPWLVVSITGTTAATVAGALAYTATLQTSEALASGTGIGINILGSLGSYLATSLMGDVAGVSVRVASQVAGQLTKESIKSSGRSAAVVASATTATLTALSITIGSYVIHYSIEYGGILSEKIARKLGEMVLRYSLWKDGRLGDLQTGYLENGGGADCGWVVICDDKDGEKPGKEGEALANEVVDGQEGVAETAAESLEDPLVKSLEKFKIESLAKSLINDVSEANQ